MHFDRQSGILLHPTSLPGPHGIGDFGESAFRFVDWLHQAGQALWQVMPLGPIGYGNSPYASPSSFAGNDLLISLPWLEGDGLIESSDYGDVPELDDDHVLFEQVTPFKRRVLRTVFDRFRRGAAGQMRGGFETFCEAEQQWLDDFALFMALKDVHEGQAWFDWDHDIKLREPEAMASWSERLVTEVRFHKFVQYLFRRQWSEVRRYANERGISIVGDIPIFVAEDSADVWSNQQLFKLDDRGNAVEVAGVPPDPFSATGQRWGNPVYDWAELRKQDFAWWVERIEAVRKTVDIVRIDHFRGFSAAWLVPAAAETAAEGHWELAPGREVFTAVQKSLGPVPVIVEDLGVITPDVIELRDHFGFPGMNVLQFAFGEDATNAYLPHNHVRNSVVYTGTHDNQTTVGWFHSRPEHERTHIQTYLGSSGQDIAWDMMRMALGSVADLAIIPMQDVLRLGDEARMNVPGEPEGNWSWRYRREQLDSGLAEGLRALSRAYGRGIDYRRDRDPNPWDYTREDGEHRASDPLSGV